MLKSVCEYTLFLSCYERLCQLFFLYCATPLRFITLHKLFNNIIIATDEVRGCKDGSVRLEGGFSSLNGRVEFCMDRRWGGVCSDGFDLNDARIVCRELNYNPEGKHNYWQHSH